MDMLKPSDKVTLLDRIAPISQGAGTVTGAWIQAGLYHQLLAEIDAGVLGAAATLDFKIEQAQDGAGTGVKAIAGASITQMVKATDDGKVAFINLDVNKLDAANGFDFVRISATVGTAASLIAARLYGMHARYAPGAHNAAVKESVSVF